MNATRIKLPVRAQFSASGIVIAGTKRAHGDAGWTVINCEDIEHARQIMATYPQARMPAWARIERR